MSLNIENWQARDDTWRHNARIMTSFVQKILVDSDCHEFVMIQNAWKPIRLLYYNDILELMRKHSMLTLKWHKQHKIVEILLSESRVYWRNGILSWLSLRFHSWHLLNYLGELTALSQCLCIAWLFHSRSWVLFPIYSSYYTDPRTQDVLRQSQQHPCEFLLSSLDL